MRLRGRGKGSGRIVELLDALIAAVRAENHAPLLAKAVIELWSQIAPQDADDWLYQARQIAGQIAEPDRS